jgi:hypothetical protein
MELSELDQSKNKYTLNLLFRKVNMEIVIPLFTGVLCSLFVCALIGASFGLFKNTPAPQTPPVVVEYQHEEEIGNFLLTQNEVIQVPVLEYFSDPEYRQWVLDFFSNICINQEIVLAILENSKTFDVPPALAFAVSWEESRLNPNAINRYNRDGSVDRGLFQLNSRSFPNLEAANFYDIRINAYYGIAHLRYCLDTGKSEVSALAMYNAGTGRVKNTGAPEVTLNYINRILDNKIKIENQFLTHLIREEKIRLAETLLVEEDAYEKEEKIPQLNRTLISTSPLLSSL